MRRAVIGSQTRGYGVEFAKLAQKVDETQPLASLKAAMARMPASYTFPQDEAFRFALEEGDHLPQARLFPPAGGAREPWQQGTQ